MAVSKDFCSSWPSAFAASILLHGLLIFSFCRLGWNPQADLSQALLVDLLAPPVSVAATVDTPKPRLERFKSEQHADPKLRSRAVEPLNEYRQDTIYLNTRQPKYVKYTSKIKQRIYSCWHYPEQARREYLQGQLLLGFAILNSGELADIQVLKTSGHRLLDQGAIDAVNSVKRLPPLPASLNLDRLNIRARFHYRLISEG